MITLEFVIQTGKTSQALKFSVSAQSDKAALQTALNESVNDGRTLELIAHEHDNDTNAFVKSMTFGIGSDAKQEGLTGDSVFPTFFAANRLFSFLIVYNNTAAIAQLSGGTTLAGTDLFSGVTIAASGYTAIALDKSTSAVTPFYIHDGGGGDTWNSCTLDIKTVSEAI
jgi:hypothetical protein